MRLWESPGLGDEFLDRGSSWEVVMNAKNGSLQWQGAGALPLRPGKRRGAAGLHPASREGRAPHLTAREHFSEPCGSSNLPQFFLSYHEALGGLSTSLSPSHRTIMQLMWSHLVSTKYRKSVNFIIINVMLTYWGVMCRYFQNLLLNGVGRKRANVAKCQQLVNLGWENAVLWSCSTKVSVGFSK